MILSLLILHDIGGFMIEIYNNGNIKISIDSTFSIDEYVNFILKIKSYKFYGEHNFCISKTNLTNAIKQLQELYNCMEGNVTLCDYDSESFISFEFNNNHAYIYGQLGSDLENNLWRFKQEVDQTIIMLLVVNLNKLI